MYTIQGLIFEMLRMLLIIACIVYVPQMALQVYRGYRAQAATRANVLISLLLNLFVIAACLILFFIKPFDDLEAFTGIPFPAVSERLWQFSVSSYSILRYSILGIAALVSLTYCFRGYFKWRKGECELRFVAFYLFLFLLCLFAVFG